MTDGERTLQLRREAGGRCQCTGQCGFTHGWHAKVKPRRCATPEGCLIVRKKGYPSYWQLAGDNLQFPEEYENAAVRVRLGPVTIDGKPLVMCDRCRAGVDKRKAKKK